MITAKEVIEITQKKNSTKEKILENIQRYILLASNKGSYEVGVVCGITINQICLRRPFYYQLKIEKPTMSEMCNVEKELVLLGYKVRLSEQTYSITMDVSWL